MPLSSLEPHDFSQEWQSSSFQERLKVRYFFSDLLCNGYWVSHSVFLYVVFVMSQFTRKWTKYFALSVSRIFFFLVFFAVVFSFSVASLLDKRLFKNRYREESSLCRPFDGHITSRIWECQESSSRRPFQERNLSYQPFLTQTRV